MKLFTATSISVLIAGGFAMGTLDFTPNEKVNPKPEVAAETVDTYRVIKVNGQILFVRTGKDMGTGDIFKSNEKLNFKTPESRAAVISKLVGRKILTAKNSKGNKATLLPAMNNISSRSGAMINLIDLKNHFSEKYVIVEETRIKINSETFPQDEDQFFFMRYEFDGETINKKLEHNGDTLIMNVDEICSIDGEPIDGSKIEEMTLFYREENASKRISDFSPVFPDPAMLKEEISIIMKEVPKGEDPVDEANAYIMEFYGKVDRDNLETWMGQHFKLK